MEPTIKMPDGWKVLHLPGRELSEARIQCHYAVQVNTRLARAYIPEKSDDSHTSLEWDAATETLVGGGPFHLGLHVADLTLTLPEAAFPLVGKTFDEALRWLADARKLDIEALKKPQHFQIEDHPLARGDVFYLNGKLCAELANWFGNAALCLATVASPVRCWPHHFDIATQIVKDGGSIGVGLSPDDDSYPEPYFYVSPWPYPEASKLPSLSHGHWHTEKWTGAVLTSSQIVPEGSQYKFVQGFINEVLASLR